MKKLLAMVLVFVLVLSFAACGGDDETSKITNAGTSKTESTDSSKTESKNESKTESSEASSDVVSDDSSATSSGDVSDVTSEDEDAPVEVTFLTQFISWKGHFSDGYTQVKSTDSTSLRISKINDANIVQGDVAVFTSEYGLTLPDFIDYSNFAIVKFEYNHDIYTYNMTSFTAVGEAEGAVSIPKDGWITVIHKNFQDKINAIKATVAKAPFYPHGFLATDGLFATIAKKTAKVDGKISTSEYGKPIWTLSENSKYSNYEQFDGNNFASAEVYVTYDKDNLYFAVVVNSPYHFNNLAQEKAGEMWSAECIQVNVSAKTAISDYMAQHWDHQVDHDAHNKNIVRQYGFAVNDNGETIHCKWIGNGAEFGGETVCIRDEASQKTYYEVSIPWSECGSGDDTIKVEKGESFGFSVSINCGDEENLAKQGLVALTLRDGGGIIGINDWSKVPVLTFG